MYEYLKKDISYNAWPYLIHLNRKDYWVFRQQNYQTSLTQPPKQVTWSENMFQITMQFLNIKNDKVCIFHWYIEPYMTPLPI